MNILPRPRPRLLSLACLAGLALTALPARVEAAPQAKKTAAEAKEAKLLAAWGLVEKDGKWRRKDDLAMLEKGMVQHPDTGRWIKKEDLEKANADQYPVKDQWVAIAEADKAHKSWSRPWVLLGDNIELHTTYGLTDAKNILNEAESAVNFARNLLWDPTMPLPKRVIVVALKTSSSYQDFGNEYDESGFSSHGAFYCTGRDDRPVAVYYGAKNWGPYYLKHAVGLGVAAQLLVPLGVAERHWILTGFGGYAARWSNSTSSSHFGKQYIAKGGVRSLKSFPKNFKISGEMSAADLDWTIYQAGILVAYLGKSPSSKAQKAWDAVRKAIKTRDKKTAKTVAKFEKTILSHQKQLRKFLETLVKG